MHIIIYTARSEISGAEEKFVDGTKHNTASFSD